MITVKSEKISSRLEMIEYRNTQSPLNSIIYLLNTGPSAVLIGSWPSAASEDILETIRSVSETGSIEYAVIHEILPDTFSSINILETNGFRGKIVSSWRNSLLLSMYDIKSRMHIIETDGYSVTLSCGKAIDFISAPHLFSPGSFMTYDPDDKILFSDKLFGSFTNTDSSPAYDPVILFHSHFIASSEILNDVISKISKIEISTIAPNCGKIITDNINGTVSMLSDLDCGRFIKQLSLKDLTKQDFTEIARSLILQISAVYPETDFSKIFLSDEFEYSHERKFRCKNYNMSTWQNFINMLAEYNNGMICPAIEPVIRKISASYSIYIPEIFDDITMTSLESNYSFEQENIYLRKKSDELTMHIKNTEKQLSQDTLTGLYKKNFFDEYVKSDIESFEALKLDFSFFIIDIDNLQVINNMYGKERGDEIIRNTAYILRNYKKSRPETVHHLIFKFTGPKFVYYIPDCTKEYAVKIAEDIRNIIYESDLFLKKITVSIGLIQYSEHSGGNTSSEQKLIQLTDICEMRVRIAKKRGTNNICFESTYRDMIEIENSIVLIEPDDISAHILRLHIERINYNVITARNGIDAVEEIKSKKPVLVISELFVPKSDGFMIRSNMLNDSRMKNIPFILMSYRKDHESLKRAIELEISFYLRKPFFSEELISIIRNYIRTNV